MFMQYLLAQTTTTKADVGLAVIDWIIVGLYGIGMLVLGWYFGRSQKTSKDYFVGSGGMNSLLIGVSLFATLLSTISYLSFPGEAIGKGPGWLFTLLGYPVIYLVGAYVLLPVYMKHRVTSAYELLEEKLGRGARLLGGSLFIVLRLFWMSTLIYFAAKALAVIINVEPQWEPMIVVVTGIVAVGYTSLGGLRAVVITDLIQTILLYGGAVLVIVLVSVKMGGLGWFTFEWHENWDKQPVFSLDPSVRVTMIGALLSMLTWHIATLGGDQVSVQRFMATTDIKAARKSLATNLVVGTVVMLTLFTAGYALLKFYSANPDSLSSSLSLKANGDKIFPYFIAAELPPIVCGLVVSAIFAAAMSSVDSGVNSITAVVMSDFLRERAGDEAAELKRFRKARFLAVGIGVVIIACSSLVKFVPGNITAITGKTVNLLTVPIFGLFFFALFVKNVKPVAAWLGCVAGIIVAVLIAFSGPIFGFRAVTGYDPVSFIWITPVTLLTNISVGLLANALLPGPDSAAGRRIRFMPAAIAVLFVIALGTVLRPGSFISLSDQTRSKALEVLRAGLKADEFWPSMHAAEALTLAGHADEVRSALEPRLGDDVDDQQRCGLARELVRAGDGSKAQILLDILNGEDGFGHVHAAESLFKVYDMSEPQPLKAAFADDRPDAVRLMAAAALAKAGDAAALSYLREVLQSDQDDAAKTATWILGRVGSQEDIALIRGRWSKSEDEMLRAFMQHALAALGDGEGLSGLQANLDSENPKVRVYAATFAGEVNGVKLAPRLVELLDDPDLDVRVRAAQSLFVLSQR